MARDMVNDAVYLNLTNPQRVGMDLCLGIDASDEFMYEDHLWVPVTTLAADWFFLKTAEDRPEWFPEGKAATIDAIEKVMDTWARSAKKS